MLPFGSENGTFGVCVSKNAEKTTKVCETASLCCNMSKRMKGWDGQASGLINGRTARRQC